MSETKSAESEHEGVGIIVTLATMLPFCLAWGSATSRLWAWFVAPLLPATAPRLGAAHFAGLLLFAQQWRSTKPDENQSIWTAFKWACIGYVLSPLLAVGLGWMIHHFWL